MTETSWELYSDNSQAWYSMLTDCANAKESIILEQFIFMNDDFGKKLLNICKERASAGVKIRFLWDAGGSFSFWGSNIVQELKASGIELLFWRTLIPDYFKVPNFRYWYLRNHRRTMVIDGKIGYTGSICVMDAFKNWRDTNVRLEGPVVKQMQNAFEQMWSKALKVKKIKKLILPFNAEFKYITNYPVPGGRKIYAELVKAITRAEKSINITVPYFVPTHQLSRVLRSASKRGVEVRLIIPERSNHFSVDLGARAFFKTMLQSGVRIFLYTGNMIHSKSIVIDGDWATVGSMNLDSVSLLYNFEANIVTTNKKFAKELTEHFERDLKEAREVSLAEWQNRFFLEKIPEYLIHIVRKFL